MSFACLLKEKANKQQLVLNYDFVSRKQQPKGKVNAFVWRETRLLYGTRMVLLFFIKKKN